MSLGLAGLGALGASAAAGAGWAVHRHSHTPAASGLWWLAAALTLVAAVPAHATPVPVAAVLSAGGLMAAAVIDAVEGRIPTPIAYVTTSVALGAVLGQAVLDDAWAEAAQTFALTAALVVTLALLWAAGQVGFGDVRLAGGLAAALAGGVGGLVVLAYVTVVTAAALVLIRRRRAWARSRAPFGPPLVAGWLAACTWLAFA